MKILITGANGQLGSHLSSHLSSQLSRRAQAALTAPLHQLEVVALDRNQFDLSQPQQLAATLDAIQPNIIINTAAYTAVDKAEQERELAFAVNAHSPAAIAAWCAQNNAALIHYSTDYVFDGSKRTPWLESDATNPLSVYGASKRAGEEAIQALIKSEGLAAITLRTSWVYAAHGKNFLLTMLKLAKDRQESLAPLTVVDDQLGAPTTVDFLADVTFDLIGNASDAGAIVNALQHKAGIYHCTMAGEVTWRGFAQRIFEIAVEKGLLRVAPAVNPTSTAAYNAPAPRPLYSVMSNEKRVNTFSVNYGGIELTWQDGLNQTLETLYQSR